MASTLSLPSHRGGIHQGRKDGASLKNLFHECVMKAAHHVRRNQESRPNKETAADRVMSGEAPGMPQQDKTMLLMKSITDKRVLQLLYRTMLEL